MNSRLKDLHILVMYILAFAGILTVVLSSIATLGTSLLITMGWLFSFTLRNLYLYHTEHSPRMSFLTYATEVILLFTLWITGGPEATKALLLITIADCYITWNVGVGTICAGVSFVLFLVQPFLHQPLTVKNIFFAVTEEAPIFLIVGLVSNLLSKVLTSNAQIEQSNQAIKIRETELQSAYAELRQAYENLEELAALKERNRIARDIHDTVGHTITTAIVAMEAGKMLAGKDSLLSTEKFFLGHAQAIKALDQLRKSVKLLTRHDEPFSLREALFDVISETEVLASVTIRSRIDLPMEIGLEIGELITRILKEGLSNGIRHGQGTAFFFKLATESNTLSFLLQDNGIGCDSITPGFGLENMKKSVLQEGGEIEFVSELGEGFEIRILLPLEKEKRYGSYQGAAGR